MSSSFPPMAARCAFIFAVTMQHMRRLPSVGALLGARTRDWI